MHEAQRLAEELATREPKIHIFVANACESVCRYRYTPLWQLHVSMARMFPHSHTLDDGRITIGPLTLVLFGFAAPFLDAPKVLTKDGLERTLAIGFYSHAALVLLLQPQLRAAGAEGRASARVVLQASLAEAYGTMDLRDLKVPTYSLMYM